MSQQTRAILLFLTLLCLQQIGFSQAPSPKKEWGISIGTHKAVFKDLVFAPFKYEGNGQMIAIDYRRNTKGGNIFQVQGRYASAIIASDFSPFTETAYINARLQVEYLHRLSKPTNKFQYYLGSSLQTNINYVNYDDEAWTYFNLHTVNLAANIEYQLSAKSTLRGQLTLPLLGISVRPPLTGWDHTLNTTAPLTLIYKGDLATIGNFIELATQLTYAYQLSQKMDVQVHALYNYQHTNKTNAFSSAAAQLAIGLNFKF